MGERRAFSCDVQGCTAERREVNHWWLCVIMLPRLLKAQSFYTVTFSEFHFDTLRAHADTKEIATVCGEKHAQVLYARWLANGTFEARERGFEERGTVSGTAATGGEKSL